MSTEREVSLSPNQRAELNSIARSHSLPAGYVFRAKLILMLAEGASFSTIKRRLQTSAPTILSVASQFEMSWKAFPHRGPRRPRLTYGSCPQQRGQIGTDDSQNNARGP